MKQYDIYRQRAEIVELIQGSVQNAKPYLSQESIEWQGRVVMVTVIKFYQLQKEKG